MRLPHISYSQVKSVGRRIGSLHRERRDKGGRCALSRSSDPVDDQPLLAPPRERQARCKTVTVDPVAGDFLEHSDRFGFGDAAGKRSRPRGEPSDCR